MSMHDQLALLSAIPSQQRALFKGLEKEGLRVHGQAIAQDDHPKNLGSTLTHPYITTDYSEALLEFITPVYRHAHDLLGSLQAMHQFSLAQLGEQYIWPGSMPCKLDNELSVRIANYGDSHQGQLKHVYRHGLWHRYGRIMQAIAGLHFNFSIGDAIWQALANAKGVTDSPEFRTQGYFDLIRNFRRHQWLLLYLFSASPGFDKSFKVGRSSQLPKAANRSHLAPQATSLRMSDIGYSNHIQSDLFVCFNSLESYCSTLENALAQSHPSYEQLGVKKEGQWQQLNTHVLQIENEYYSDIRPKRVGLAGEKPLESLRRRGVEYIEVRCLDLNPYLPLGVDEHQIRFIDTFLLWCLLEDSPKLTESACNQVRANQKLALLQGQDAEVQLISPKGPRSIREWGLDVIDALRPVAQWLEPSEPGTLDALVRQQAKLQGLVATPAQQLSQQMLAGKDYLDICEQLGRDHKQELLAQPVNSHWQARLQDAVPQSLQEQAELEANSHGRFEDFLSQWLQRDPPSH